MSFDLALAEARLGLVTWRNSERENISEQLETAFPALLRSIEDAVAGMSLWNVGWAHANLTGCLQPLMQDWIAAQAQIATDRAQMNLEQLVGQLRIEAGLADHLGSAVPAMVGVGLIAGSMLAVPSLVTFATVTSTTLFFVTTSAISIPTMVLGTAGLMALGLTGTKVVGHATDKTRTQLVSRLSDAARTLVFGYGLPPGARCVVNDLQAAIMKAGETELAGA